MLLKQCKKWMQSCENEGTLSEFKSAKYKFIMGIVLCT